MQLERAAIGGIMARRDDEDEVVRESEKRPLEATGLIGLLEEMYEKNSEIALKNAEVKAIRNAIKESVQTFLDETETTEEAINVAYKAYAKYNDDNCEDLEPSNAIEEAMAVMNMALSSHD